MEKQIEWGKFPRVVRSRKIMLFAYLVVVRLDAMYQSR